MRRLAFSAVEYGGGGRSPIDGLVGMAMPGPVRLYDVDFYRRTREQAALLQRIPDERLNISRGRTARHDGTDSS